MLYLRSAGGRRDRSQACSPLSPLRMNGATLIDRISRRLVPWLIRQRRPVLFAALLIGAVASVFAVRLYGDLRSGIEELLPESTPSVIAAKSLGGKLRSFSRLSVVLEGEDPDGLARFADALAPRLRALPPRLVESVDYQTGEQDRFVGRFGALYLPIGKLRTFSNQLAARITWEKERANPLVVSLDDESAQAPEISPPNEAASQTRFRDGRWQTPDGKLLVLQVTPPDSSTDASRNQALLEAVKMQVALLDPHQFDARMHVGYSGEVTELVEEQAALVADLASSTAVVLLLVVLALWLFFRSWPVLLSLFGSLALGCALCFGLSYFLIGHLNANTAFLGSIVLGNGINVGIVLVARVLEERRNGAVIDEAIRLAWSRTLSSTFVAAFGAALAYLSLAATDFRGFSQFGVIGALGMSLCWLSAYLLLPPLLSAIDAWRPIGMRAAPGKGLLLARISRSVEAQPWLWLFAAALLLAGSGLAIARRQGPLIEVDPGQLRAKKSLESGAQFWSGKADQVFHAYLNPVVLHAGTPPELAQTLAALETRRAALGADDPIGEVRGLAALVPPLAEQNEKLVVLAQIRAQLDDRLLAHLTPELRAQALELRPPADLAPVRFEDLPSPVRRALTERSGAVGTIALLFPRKAGLMNLNEAEQLKSLVRDAIADAGPSSQAVNPLFLLSDIDEAIWHDGPRATLLALFFVCLLVLLVIRNFRASATVLGSLFAGLIGLLGIAAAAQVRVNFLNFVVLPITFGIGVDYAVNIVLRYRQEGKGSVGRVLRETGGAVALCSATTIIGYASLLVADNQALAGFGLLASLGEVTCLSAALLALPAWLLVREARDLSQRGRAAEAPAA